MPRPPRAVQSYAALALLTALATGLALARGGVDAPTLVVEVMLVAAAAVLAMWHLRELPLAVVLLGAILLLQLMQLVPFPAAFHGLSQIGSRVFQVSLQPLGLYPGPRPFSLDPISSAARFAEGFGCLAAFLAAWTFSGSRRRLHFLCAGIGFSGVVIATVVLGAALFGIGPIFEPRFPFVNPNHLAAFTNLTAFVCLGLAFHGHGPERVLWLLGFVVIAAVGVLSLSRAGLGALLFGAALFGVLYARREGHQRRGAAMTLTAVGVAVGTVLSLAAYLASDSLLAELRTVPRVLEESKPILWRTGLALVRESPWLGIGRGAFGLVFAAYKPDAVAVTYTHVESSWLQAFIDLGVPGGLLLVAGLAWLWLRAARWNARSALQVGLLAGTAAVAFHDLADFSLEIPGVAIPFFACLGALGDRAGTVSLRRGTFLAVAGAAAMLALAGAGVGAAALRRAVETPGLSPDQVVAAASADVRWHPADYLPHAAAGASLAAADRCGEALPWLTRAMLLNPTEAGSHRSLGRCFWAAGERALAAREYRLATAFGDRTALEESIPRFPVLAELLQAVPDTPDDRFRLALALPGDRQGDAAEVLQLLLDEDLDARALLPLARARLSLRQYGPALELARRLVSAAPAEPQGYLIAYSSLVGLGQDLDAEQVLSQGSAAVPGNPELLTVLWQRSLVARRYTEARRLAEQIVPRSGADVTRRELLVAQALAAQQRVPEAIERARAAAASSPDAPEPLVALAGLLGSIRRYDEAIDALERAAGLPGADAARCRAQMTELRRAAADQAAQRRLGLDPP